MRVVPWKPNPGWMRGTVVERAHAMASSTEPNGSNCRSVVQVGGGSAISPARQRAIASAGRIQTPALVSRPQCDASCAAGSTARKK